ncbi:Thyrotropin-releasing hormone receptor [Trichoplax sp. H2]|nr:Thyrotropin-releasing hormone receptor [Trichoplax sp. H2]|eukprot:RDD45584.1 Thyrotropin-releasing hormone receptor [Trichoplax sp. H2]
MSISNSSTIATTMKGNQTEVILGTEYIISGLLTLFTNGALLMFILANKKLKTSKLIIICSTLIAGILFASCYILPRFTLLLKNGQSEWPQDYRCGLISRLGLAIFFCLNIHLIMRIMEMYIQICHPFQSQHVLTSRNITLAISLVWLITLSIPAGFQIYFETSVNITSLQDKSECHRLSNNILITFSIILAGFSAIILIICSTTYARILCIAKSSRKRLRHLSTRTSSTTDSCITCQDSNQENSKRNSKIGGKLGKMDKSLTQTLILFIFYLLAIMPFLVLVLYTQLYYNAFVLRRWPRNLILLFRYCQYVAFLFPAFQPILFMFFTADIRKAVFSRLRCQRKETRSPSCV